MGFYVFDNSGESLISKAKLYKNLLNLITFNSTSTPVSPGEGSFAWPMGLRPIVLVYLFQILRKVRFLGFLAFARSYGRFFSFF